MLDTLSSGHPSHADSAHPLLSSRTPLPFPPLLFGLEIIDNIARAAELLRASGHPAARAATEFLAEAPRRPLDFFASGAYRIAHGFRQAVRAVNTAEEACWLPDSAGLGDCLDGPGVAAAREDAHNSFLAYVALLSWENRIIQAT